MFIIAQCFSYIVQASEWNAPKQEFATDISQEYSVNDSFKVSFLLAYFGNATNAINTDSQLRNGQKDKILEKLGSRSFKALGSLPSSANPTFIRNYHIAMLDSMNFEKFPYIILNTSKKIEEKRAKVFKKSFFKDLNLFLQIAKDNSKNSEHEDAGKLLLELSNNLKKDKRIHEDLKEFLEEFIDLSAGEFTASEIKELYSPSN